MKREHGVVEMEELKDLSEPENPCTTRDRTQWGGGALSSDYASKEVRKKLRNFSLAIKKACHCEDERSEDVAIAKSLNINEITTQSSIARNDTNRHPERVSGSQADTVFSRFTSHFSRKRVAFTLAEGATHVDTCDGKRKIAFTLAEVLITLGIIGVVVALTIPIIATKYRKYVLLNKIEHTYTLLNNTLERAKADYGTDINQWELSEGTKLDKSTFFVENYILPYLNVLQYCGRDYTKQGCFEQVKRLGEGVTIISPTSSNYGTSFILNNGTYVYLEVGRGNDNEPENTKRIQIVFDVDGPNKGKNTYGYDVFRIELGGDESSNISSYDLADKNKFLPYLYDPKKSCDYYVSTVNHGCNKDSVYGGSMCLAYIFCNGWDFGDKYIW